MNFSELFKLNHRDLINGAVMAVLAALAATIDTATFNIFDADWLGILKIAGGAAITYLLKNLLTANNGKVLGKV